jgi:cytidylate kinase
MIMRDDPRALHVRLDGPVERRVEQAMRIQGVDRETAERLLRESDRAREAYVRHFYDVDPRDPRHYDLVLDSTAFTLEACIELIATAARLRED